MILCLCFGTSFAMADGVMPIMPPPPETPVYWQLTSIEQTPEIRPSAGYSLQSDLLGLELDLDDGLLTESLLMSDDALQGISLIVSKSDEAVMQHIYTWTPMPIYLEPGTSYPIEITSTTDTDSNAPNSLLGVYIQGEIAARISAGGYTGHATSTSIEVTTENGIYSDGRLVVSFILRDVNDMFRNRIVFTYEMHEGVKPVPTPIPGFAAVDVESENVIPAYYVPVEGRTEEEHPLWQIVTAPDEYRAYGSMSGSEPTFFPADAQGDVVMNEIPADVTADYETYVEGFVPEVPQSTPVQYTAQDGVYSFVTRDGETLYRAYGRMNGTYPAFFPADERGAVAEDAQPVLPEEDFATYVEGFGIATPPEEVDDHYVVAGEGLYSFTGRDGETRYRAFGRLNGADPAFYPADEQGNVEADAVSVYPQDDFEAYIRGFDSVTPETVPTHYYIVREELYAVDDREGTPVYRVFGIKDGAEPAFYPADESGMIVEGAEPVDPEVDFENHVAGFEVTDPTIEIPDFYQPTEVPNVWTFTDKGGKAHYRTYGSLHRGEEAFYPSDEGGAVQADALPVQPASDLAILPPPPFTTVTPETLPVHYSIVEGKESVYSFTDAAGETVYRIFGSFGKATPQFYPADEDGNPVYQDAIDPTQEHEEQFGAFIAQEPEELPEHYTAVPDVPGLFTITNREGETAFRIYGAHEEGQEPVFYPADETGKVLGGKAIDTETDYETRFAAFTPSIPKANIEVPAQYTQDSGSETLFSFTTKTGETEYRVHGAFGDGETAFYPADKDGNVLSGQPVDPATDAASAALTVSGTVVTPEPPVEPETTPLVRIGDGTTRWTDPSAPTPTPVVTGSVVTQAPTGETDPSVTRSYTPTPEATEITATIVPESTDNATPAVIAQATDLTKPDPTEETVATNTPTAEGTDTPTAAPTDAGEPATGTTARSPLLWIVLGAVAVAIIGGVIFYIKKKKK